MKSFLFLLLLVPSALQAQSSRWLVISAPGARKVELDTAGIIRDGPYVAGWSRGESKPGQDKFQGKKFASLTSRLVVDCAAGKAAQSAAVIYDSKGESLYSTTAQMSELEFEPPPPESIEELKLKLICSMARRHKLMD